MSPLLFLPLSGSALAGPLLLPDPDDMGAYRCKDHPVGLQNNIEVAGDYSVTESPPGSPSFAHGVESSLVPYATDSDLKAAAKGKGMHALPALTSLAVGGAAVPLACSQRSATDQDFFTHGCKKPLACDLVLRTGGKVYQLEQRDEVGARLAAPRIDSYKQALGLVAMLDPSVFLPITPTERAAWTEMAAHYVGIEPAVHWLEIEEHEDGYLLRAPRLAACGCERDLVRRAWWVSKDGRSCQVEETPVALAKSTDAPCVE